MTNSDEACMSKLPETDDIFKEISKYISQPSLISITGGGGKTSLMFYLARIMSRAGNVICSTTTKLCPQYPYEVPVILAAYRKFDELKASVSNTLDDTSPILIGETEKGGKLIGISPNLANELFMNGIAQHVLIEADGALAMPFKVYESYEPVIPSLTTLHIVVVGSEVLFSPLTRENTFRFELLRKRWKISGDEVLRPDKITETLKSHSEYLKGSPAKAKRLLFFNKYDLISRPGGKREQIATPCIGEGFDFSCLFEAYDAVIFASLKDNTLNVALSLWT